MSSTEHRLDPDNSDCLIGGTAFEHCHQNPVKGSGCCYSLIMIHQYQRALVGPTALIKQYDQDKENNSESLNLEIRGKITQVNCLYIFILLTQISIFYRDKCSHGDGSTQDWCTEGLYRAPEKQANIINLP